MSSGYSPEQLGQWSAQLIDLAQQAGCRSASRRAAVEQLIIPIQAALQQHSYEEVAQKLSEWGLVMTPGSLKQYVCRYRRQQRRRTRPHALDTTQSRPQRVSSPKIEDLERASTVTELATFDLQAELSAVGERPQAVDSSIPWTEARFNRNRVRPH
jgi:hypothetical protein